MGPLKASLEAFRKNIQLGVGLETEVLRLQGWRLHPDQNDSFGHVRQSDVFL